MLYIHNTLYIGKKYITIKDEVIGYELTKYQTNAARSKQAYIKEIRGIGHPFTHVYGLNKMVDLFCSEFLCAQETCGSHLVIV